MDIILFTMHRLAVIMDLPGTCPVFIFVIGYGHYPPDRYHCGLTWYMYSVRIWTLYWLLRTYYLSYYLKRYIVNVVKVPIYVTEFAKRGLIHASDFATWMRHNFACD